MTRRFKIVSPSGRSARWQGLTLILTFSSVLASTGSLSGCAAIGGDAAYSAVFRTKFVDTETLSEEELRQFQLIKVYESRDGLRLTSRGKVTGLACSLSAGPLIPIFHWTPPLSDLNGKTPQDVAMNQMKVKAMKLGANGVVSLTCNHHEWVDWGNNCFESWSCTGEAVQVTQE
jgi:hypothetical protein